MCGREGDVTELSVKGGSAGEALLAFYWEIPSTGLEEVEVCGNNCKELKRVKGWSCECIEMHTMCVCVHCGMNVCLVGLIYS